jgi:hypothetical protein
MKMLKHLWETQRLVLSAFVLAAAVFCYFAATTTMSMIYWMDPAHQDQPLAGWMTPRYVSHSYKLPPEIVGPALSIVKGDMLKRQSLDAIAAAKGMTMDEMQDSIDTTAAVFRASKDAGK